MRKQCLGTAGVIVLLSFGASARGESYKIDDAESSMTFSVHQFVNVVHGKFKTFSGTVTVDRGHPDQSAVTASIRVKSIDTGIRKRDEHLLSAEFFDAEKYPEMTFKSRRVTRTGTASGDVTGDFTMHGVTRPVTLHVRLLTPEEKAVPQVRWQVTADPIKRSDYNLLFSRSAELVSGISQEVGLRFEIATDRID